MFLFHRALAWSPPIALAALIALPQAQAAGTAVADPADPRAAVPAAGYTSAFSGYRAHAEPPLQGWRAANDEVSRIGGWRVYTREAHRALSAPAAAPVPSPAPVPAPATPAPPAPSKPASEGGRR